MTPQNCITEASQENLELSQGPLRKDVDVDVDCRITSEALELLARMAHGGIMPLVHSDAEKSATDGTINVS